jgi:hypothetical protein
VERPLKPYSCLFKIWQAWGAEAKEGYQDFLFFFPSAESRKFFAAFSGHVVLAAKSLPFTAEKLALNMSQIEIFVVILYTRTPKY